MDVSLDSPGNAAFFRRRCGPHAIAVAHMGGEKGKGIVATAGAPAGHTLMEDAPFASMQHESNSSTVQHCLQCHKPLGAAPAAAAHASGAAGEACDRGATPCPGECGEVRSPRRSRRLHTLTRNDSPASRGGAAILQRQVLHRGLGLAPPHAVPLALQGRPIAPARRILRTCLGFDSLAPPFVAEAPYDRPDTPTIHDAASNEIFSLAARVIARIVAAFQAGASFNDAVRPFALLHKRMWWEVRYSHADSRAFPL